MKEYIKIETIFKRDINGTKKLIPWAYRNSTMAYLSYNDWIWTEKIDGTNIRVHWDGHKVEFGGRTDKAQIPAALVTKLNEYFGGETNAQLFEQAFGDRDVIIFGEGYGAKIQNGGSYTDGTSVDFAMFDLMVGDNYQDDDSVVQCADMFGVPLVPCVGSGTLKEAVAYVKSHKMSMLGNRSHEMEGLVCRPAIELNDRCHNRVIVKIKWSDLKDLEV